MTGFDLLPFVALGALVGLDVVSFPQMMISRPLVAATVAGALAGDAMRGLLIGVVLEMVALGTLPFGASRYPEWGSASVAGGALYATGSAAPAGHLALATLAALLAAWLSGESMVWLRKLNAHWARDARAALDTGRGGVVVSLQLRGLVADFVRGGFVVALALGALSPVYRLLGARWTGGVASERTVLAGLTAALGGATIWMLVRGTPGARYCIGLGIAAAAALML